MAKKLINIPNTGPANVDYPNGKINDDSGSGNGTPVNEAVIGDIIQFFQKLLIGAGITANNLFDNDNNGYQLVDALDDRIHEKMPPTAAWLNMTSAGNYDLDYRLTNLDSVQVRLLLQKTFLANVTILTLPSGYRPTKELVFSTEYDGSIIIQTNGVVKSGGNGAKGFVSSTYYFYEFPID